MHKRTLGLTFICIAAFLYSVRYICAAIWLTNRSTWGPDVFEETLKNIGNGPLVLSIIAFIIGILYLVIAEFGIKIKNNAEEIKKKWSEF